MIIYMYMYFCFQVLSRFLEEFRVPASASTITMLDGKLFQFFITVSVTTYTRLVTVLVCAIQIIKALCVLYAFLSESEWYRLYLTVILSESVLFIDIVIIIIVIMSVCSYKSALQISLSFM